jgi:hypothetical protein
MSDFNILLSRVALIKGGLLGRNGPNGI